MADTGVLAGLTQGWQTKGSCASVFKMAYL